MTRPLRRLAALLLAFSPLAGCGDSAGTYTDDAGDPGPGPGGPIDLSVAGNGPHDMAHAGPPPDLVTTPITGSVTAQGGTVSRLFFGFSGDARPSQCNEHNDYPTAILDSIFTRMAASGVQFGMDLGDHMFVCQNGSQAEATAQMNLYMAAAHKLGKPVFLTLGNHDCVSMTNPGYCGVNLDTVNYRAFLNALSSEGLGATPYYSFEVKTNGGLARFIVIADNAWGNPEQTWLQAQIADADAKDRYIFIFRHHPLDNTDWPAFATISQIIKTSKHLTMLFEGHTHEWRLDTFNDRSGRTSIVGNAGAPLTNGFTWYGYGTAEQLDTGVMQIRLYDQASGAQMAAYRIAPQ